MFVNVAISKGSGAVFSYSVPPDKCSTISLGKRVLVPLGSRRATGYIVEVTENPPRDNLKDIIEIVDSEPLFDEKDLALYQWAARYYLYPLGKTLSGALPSGIDIKSDRRVALSQENTPKQSKSLSQEQASILDILKTFPDGCGIRSLKKACPQPSLEKHLKSLVRKGLVTIEERLQRPNVQKKMETLILPGEKNPEGLKLTEKQRVIVTLVTNRTPCTLSLLARHVKNPSATVKILEQKGLVVTEQRERYRDPRPPQAFCLSDDVVELNEDQKKALTEITCAIENRVYAPFLLHGVTGSGKTEIYLRAMEATLAAGGSALLMVPEIALTSLLINRVRSRFDDSMIALFHSGLSEGERYDQWRKMQRGAARILIGARSAIFVPARDLRLIVVDEEHDASYKQDERLPYNARDLALVRARMTRAAVILGSATPDVQTFHNVQHKGFTCLSLPKRVENRALPAIHIIDMKEPALRRGKGLLLSSPLVTALKETLEQGNQSLLLLNRRGFTTFLFCGECGHVFNCLHCSVTMTHHKQRNILKCHYCDYSVKAPPLCPNCMGQKIVSFGAGTEKLFLEVEELFPEARIARLDSDTVSKRTDYEVILSALDRREIDILIGTQMIAKGHDFPHVTLVGVVSADSSLNIPDFRSSERTFQILTQVSGRGGRGKSPGRVFIQTINPSNSSIQKAALHDYQGFYEEELLSRQETGFPPFQRMINVRITSATEEDALTLGRLLADAARKYIAAGNDREPLTLLGPAEPPLARVKGRYRRQMLIKGSHTGSLHDLAELLLKTAGRRASDVKIDVDPLSFM